jgi:hypothetical protein
MTIESIRESISFDEILGLIPKFIEARERTTTVAEGAIWRKVLEKNGYNPDLASHIYDEYIIKRNSRYTNAIREAQSSPKQNKPKKQPHTTDRFDGPQDPIKDVFDQHYIETHPNDRLNY